MPASVEVFRRCLTYLPLTLKTSCQIAARLQFREVSRHKPAIRRPVGEPVARGGEGGVAKRCVLGGRSANRRPRESHKR